MRRRADAAVWWWRLKACAVLVLASPAGAQHRLLASVPLQRMTMLLANASGDDLRALIAHGGLDVCTARFTNSELDPWAVPGEQMLLARQQCRQVPPAGLSDDLLRQMQRTWGFGSLPGEVIQTPFPGLVGASLHCAGTRDAEHCVALTGGGEGVFWYYQRTAHLRRLARVVTWSLGR